MMIFRNFKTTFCKNYLIPGEIETRNVYSRVCRMKIGNCCWSVFFFVGLCNAHAMWRLRLITNSKKSEKKCSSFGSQKRSIFILLQIVVEVHFFSIVLPKSNSPPPPRNNSLLHYQHVQPSLHKHSTCFVGLHNLAHSHKLIIRTSSLQECIRKCEGWLPHTHETFSLVLTRKVK